MRLTLRTMLAYLDNVLEPEDAQDLAKKIQESKYATDLMHHISDVMRRLRLGAPKLEGRGMALDVNTVAEYLDNTMPSERVTDFERICLESDVHLAEVAAVHQILTLVLGEPVDVDSGMRDRMYQLRERPATSAAPAATAAATSPVRDTTTVAPSKTPPPVERAAITAAPAAPPASVPVAEGKDEKERPKTEIPEYLRSPPKKKKRSPALTLVALAVVAVAVAVFLTQTPAGRQMIAQFNKPAEKTGGAAPDKTTGSNQGTAGQEAVTKRIEAEPTKSGETSKGSEPTKETEPEKGSPPALEQPKQMTAPVPAAQEVTTPAATAPTATTPATTQATPTTTPPTSTTPVPFAPAPATATSVTPTPTPLTPPPTAPLPSVTFTPLVPAAPGKTSTPPPTTATSGSPATTPLIPTTTAPGTLTTPVTPTPSSTTPTTTPPATTPAATTPATTTPGTTPAPAPEPPAIVAMGTVISTDAVLTGQGATSRAGWKRLMVQAQVSSTDRLLSIPGYRSAIDLAYGLNVQLWGGSLVELVGPDVRKVPGLYLWHGRMMIAPAGNPDAELRLGLGTRQGLVSFASPDTALAVEVRPVRVDGDDPTANQSPLVMDLYVSQGEIRWLDPTTNQSTPIKAPARLSLGVPPEPGSPAEQRLPDWIVTDDRSEAEKLAAPVIEKETRGDRAITLTLKELADDRRVEVRLLSVRSLMYLGEYEALVTALRDEGQSRNWDAQIEALREACALSPDSAKRVKQAFETHRGPTKGAELFRMLWGYNADQLRKSSLVDLVRGLDSEDLDSRVLSFWNLRRIAPKVQSVYKPEYKTAQRRPHVVKWEQMLETGQLMPKAQ